MDSVQQLNSSLGNIDIYLLDQIMKGRYSINEKILDAGCGRGRNLLWFSQNGFDVHGIDRNQASIEFIQSTFNIKSTKFRHESIENISFENDYFDHVICNAVLHFAEDEQSFLRMLSRLLSVIKIGGSLFIRMTSDIGMEEKPERLSNGQHKLPDGSNRFLVTQSIINRLMLENNLSLIEPIKSVNVNNLRSMTTLIFQKG